MNYLLAFLALTVASTCSGKDVVLTITEYDKLERHAFGNAPFDGIVYRGDGRSPREIVASNGFFPKPGEDVAARYSLSEHVDDDQKNSAYVSTSRNLKIAVGFASDALRPGSGPKKLHLSDRLHKSQLCECGENLAATQLRGRMEHAAVGGIPWSQVKGFTELSIDDLRKVEKGGDVQFRPNPMYQKAGQLGSKELPELAGWSANDPAWQLKPWKSIVASKGGQRPDPKAEFCKVLERFPRSVPKVVDTNCAESNGSSKDTTPRKNATSGVSTFEGYGKEEFRKLVGQFGMNNLLLPLSTITSDIRWAAFRHRARSINDTSLVPRQLASPEIGLAIELPFYLAGMPYHTSTNKTSLAMAGSITSIEPFLGCFVEALATKKELAMSSEDARLCLTVDALLLEHLAPIGVWRSEAYHIFEKELRFNSPQDAAAHRDRLWQRIVQLEAARFNESASIHWDLEMQHLIYSAANTKAKLKTAWTNHTQITVSDMQPYNMEIFSELCKQANQLHAKLRIEVPARLFKRLEAKLRDFNKYFISRLNSTLIWPPKDYLPNHSSCLHLLCPSSLLKKERTLRWRTKIKPELHRTIQYLNDKLPSVPSLETISASILAHLEFRFRITPCRHLRYAGPPSKLKDRDRTIHSGQIHKKHNGTWSSIWPF